MRVEETGGQEYPPRSIGELGVDLMWRTCGPWEDR
jgi:hypothetical protein